MEFKNLWSTPVAIFEYPDLSINEEIMAAQEIRDCNFTNRKDIWQYKDKIPAIKKLHDWMLECSAEYAQKCYDVEYKPEYFEHDRGFIAYRKNGEEVLFHTHRLSTIVMNYYVQVGVGHGDIRLIDPRTTLGWISLDNKHYNQYNHTAKPGQMIVFPGWVIHGVSQNRNPEERVAISTNIKLKEPYSNNIT